METAPEPAPPGAARASARAADPEEPRNPEKPGEPRAGERGRLRPPPPAPVHAPLLLGLDPAGGEHPQGPDDPDDESLVGRCWGCVCGWRGKVRDVATRHFRPRVGDGGGLRRKRLARADRDARGELEHHLAATAPPPASTPPPAFVTARPPRVAGAEAAGRARGPRRRLTLPPTPTPDGDTLVPPTPAPADEGGDVEAPGTAHAPVTEPAAEPEALPQVRPPAARAEDPGAAPAAVAEPTPDPGDARGGGVLAQSATPAPAPAQVREPVAASGRGGPDQDALTSAATRARAARAELNAAETALDAVVAAARAEGASWRTIARATGIPHRDAAARWGPESARLSL